MKASKKKLATFVFLATLALASHAQAATQLIIKSGGQAATILMMAVTENPDATAFFNVLNIPAQDQGNKESKQAFFTDTQGVRSVEMTCAFSKLSSRTGSCVLGLNAANGMDISPRRVTYSIEGSDAARLAQNFVIPGSSGEVFRSSDNHLVLTIDRSAGVVSRFDITYQ
jgi:hypothetical protein